MRRLSPTLRILVTSCALGLAGTAIAAGPDANNVLSTKLGNVTCADFTQMSAQDQEQMVSEANQEAPGQTLATSPSSGNDNQSPQANSGSSDTASQAASSVPLTAGVLVSVCQAANPTETVQKAYQQSSKGGGTSGQ